MALNSEKTRILVNIPISLKEKIEIEAKKENRSVSNYIVNLIMQNLENKN
ncbi:hypothetical protein lbkm_0429 [Lachnospiraceae bacterium KM106-2]|nr:hypothetical protein lbkm_0429 [Lachnospiraceae bacterium KM106-2]